MKKSSFAPLAIFAFTMALMAAGCSTQTQPLPTTPVQTQQEQSPAEPKEIKYGDIVIGQECQDECFGKLNQIIGAGGDITKFDLKACQIGCEGAKGNL